MILLTDIYKAVNTLLESKYTDYKIYGHEVVEGYGKPSFFVSLRPIKIENSSVNFSEKSYSITITYFQSVADEIDNLIKADEIKELLGYHINVNDRKLKVSDYDFEFVGENTNILQISFNIEYFETVQRTETSAVVTALLLNEEMR